MMIHELNIVTSEKSDLFTHTVVFTSTHRETGDGRDGQWRDKTKGDLKIGSKETALLCMEDEDDSGDNVGQDPVHGDR